MRSKTEHWTSRLIAAAVIATIGFIASTENRKKETPKHSYRAQDMVAPIPKTTRITPTPEPTMNPKVKEFQDTIAEEMERIPIEVTDYEYEYIGTYLITAYCSCVQCCGWDTGTTASGETVHRADEFNRKREPTTAAIDPRLHSFGDLIYVPSEDRIYICEDTGGAVKGRHIDLYQDDHETVRGYNTRYEELYSVTISSHMEPASRYDIQRYIHQREEPKHDIKRSNHDRPE
jgi:3D (Asp-Asp-Asp) domain-containing protein